MASPTPTSNAPSGCPVVPGCLGRPSRRPGGTPHTITRMTIHHSAVVLGDNRNAPGRLRQHQQYHQDEQGWIDIAYHVGVDRTGTSTSCGPPSS